ncbi:MAG: hypothetical protein Q8O89_05210 [Nanoarchaeota archaeon]|nr:hypothetical protein [Nanoarchaeota archaeon]
MDIIYFLYNLTHNLWFYIISCTVILILVVLNLYLKRNLCDEDAESLDSFVRKALAEGHLESNIKKVLLDSGWSEREIENTLKDVRRGKNIAFLGITLPFRVKSKEEKMTEQVSQLIKEEKQDKLDVEKLLKETFVIEESVQDQTGLSVAVAKVLAMAGSLLNKLPEEERKKFENSEDFEVFKKVIDEAKSKDSSGITGKTTVQEIIALSEKGMLTKDEARKLMGFSKKTLQTETGGMSDNPVEAIDVSQEEEVAEVDGASDLKKLEDRRKQLREEQNALMLKEKSLEEKEKELDLEKADVENKKHLTEELKKALELKEVSSLEKTADALRSSEGINNETKEVLRMLDGLLANLPHEEIVAFAKSQDYEKYAHVMKEVLDIEATKPLDPPVPSQSVKAVKENILEIKKDDDLGNKSEDMAAIKNSIKSKLSQQI